MTRDPRHQHKDYFMDDKLDIVGEKVVSMVKDVDFLNSVELFMSTIEQFTQSAALREANLLEEVPSL